jgi:hypothetical protein
MARMDPVRGGDSMTVTEVRDAVERSSSRFIDACVDATHDQWQYKPSGAGDRAWTMAQTVEHVASANEGLLKVLQTGVVKSPRGDRKPDFEDDDLPYIFYGGGGPPPPGLEEPSGKESKPKSIERFESSVRAILDWYDAVEVDLRECALVHPAFGLFDGAQWLLFIAVHMRQHRGQLLDLQLACDARGDCDVRS